MCRLFFGNGLHSTISRAIAIGPYLLLDGTLDE
jgi:hypothetical protein